MTAPLQPLRLVPLGTNGYFPTHGRQTMSYLVTGPDVALVLDAGTGLGRLAEPEVRAFVESSERLDILLTHYHLDHVVGLSFLPGLWSGRAVRIFAPSPPLTAGGSEALDRLIAPPLFPVGFSRWPLAVEIVPYSSTRLEIESLSLTLRAQKHPGGSVGVRIDDRLAYVTDTVMDRGTAAFVKGVGTLLHEVWLTDEEAERDDAGRTGHSAAGAVADLAREAGVGRLVPVHHHPRRTAADLDALALGTRGARRLPGRAAGRGAPDRARMKRCGLRVARDVLRARKSVRHETRTRCWIRSGTCGSARPAPCRRLLHATAAPGTLLPVDRARQLDAFRDRNRRDRLRSERRAGARSGRGGGRTRPIPREISSGAPASARSSASKSSSRATGRFGCAAGRIRSATRRRRRCASRSAGARSDAASSATEPGTVEIELPKDAQQVGENFLELRYERHAAGAVPWAAGWDSLRFDGPRAGAAPRLDRGTGKIVLPARTAVEWTLELTGGSWLSWKSLVATGGARLAISIVSENDRREETPDDRLGQMPSHLGGRTVPPPHRRAASARRGGEIRLTGSASTRRTSARPRRQAEPSGAAPAGPPSQPAALHRRHAARRPSRLLRLSPADLARDRRLRAH